MTKSVKKKNRELKNKAERRKRELMQEERNRQNYERALKEKIEASRFTITT